MPISKPSFPPPAIAKGDPGNRLHRESIHPPVQTAEWIPAFAGITDKKDNPSQRLPIGVCIGYGSGTVGVSIMLNAVTTYYPVLMTTVLGQSPQLAGLLMMLSKLYDAVMDIVIGSLSDRTRSRWGRRRPYLLAGAFVSAASFLLIFSPPDLGNRALVAYMMGALVVYSTGYALFNVPYVAMASEMTSDFHERTRLWSFRTFFVSIGNCSHWPEPLR